MGASVGRNKGFVADINVTPFVDVMLVLLIIFMVTAPMMTEGMEVNLPATKEAKSLTTENENIVLTIRKDRRMFLDTYEVTEDTLEAQLRANVIKPGKQLFLRADKDVDYGRVVEVMGLVRSAGVEKVGLVAEQPAAQPAAPKGSAGVR